MVDPMGFSKIVKLSRHPSMQKSRILREAPVNSEASPFFGIAGGWNGDSHGPMDTLDIYGFVDPPILWNPHILVAKPW
jgi:hypothetical protein